MEIMISTYEFEGEHNSAHHDVQNRTHVHCKQQTGFSSCIYLSQKQVSTQDPEIEAPGLSSEVTWQKLASVPVPHVYTPVHQM